MTLQEVKRAAMAAGLGQVMASRQMMRLRPDGVEDTVTIEVGVPQQHEVEDLSYDIWTCTLRISLVSFIMVGHAENSLDAIISAIYLARGVLMAHPCAPEIDMSLLPYFNLPISPVTTTPDELAAEQNRPKQLRMPTMLPPEEPAQP